LYQFAKRIQDHQLPVFNFWYGDLDSFSVVPVSPVDEFQFYAFLVPQLIVVANKGVFEGHLNRKQRNELSDLLCIGIGGNSMRSVRDGSIVCSAFGSTLPHYFKKI
jgi:hypothetical protein